MHNAFRLGNSGRRHVCRLLRNQMNRHFSNAECKLNGRKTENPTLLNGKDQKSQNECKLNACKKSDTSIKPGVNGQAAKPAFGTVFTDHMLKIEYDSDLGGWQEPQITPFENLSLHPAAKALHYSIQGFEGMKAYRGADGTTRLFRPLLNLNRLNVTAKRCCLPQFDVQVLLKYLEKLVYLDRDSLPDDEDGGFYVRPTIISLDADLGLGMPNKALLYIILSPVGPYFGSGKELPSLRVGAVSKYVRAWPGGTGHTKLGGNYPTIIYVGNKVKALGCQMILWLFGEEKYITEAGVMNFFAFYINESGEEELLTPPLDGTILPGITRQSVIELSKEWNEFKVVEKPITITEIIRLNESQKLLETFGVGTASVVCPISEILYEDQLIKLPTLERKTPLFSRFYKTLSDIQYGRTSHPWSHVIDPSTF